MEGLLDYIRFVLKRIILLIIRISTLFIFHDLKKFPPARLFHPARLLDSGEYVISVLKTENKSFEQSYSSNHNSNFNIPTSAF